jgi:hypothetical protein
MKEPKMACIHKPVSSQDAVWLPPHDKSDSHIPAQRRVYCLGCGSVKYQGSDKAKKLGFFMNLLSKINEQISKENRRGVKHVKSITEVQKRLMIREMESNDIFMDPWVSTRKLQLAVFRRMLRRYCPNLTDTLLEAAFAKKSTSKV